MDVQVWTIAFGRIQLFRLMLVVVCWGGCPIIMAQDAVVSGPKIANACFGSAGIDLIANKIICSPRERVCIQNVKYGIKKTTNDGRCPHAIGFSVSRDCCSPKPEDCLTDAHPTKLSDLREECYFISPTGCTLRADRIEMQSVCSGSNFVVPFSTFRSIIYSCVPDSLASLVDDPCLLIPETPNGTDIFNFTETISQTTMSTSTTTTQRPVFSPLSVSDGDTSTVMIGAVVGGSLFFIACVVLIIFIIKLTERRNKREQEAIASIKEFSVPEMGEDLAETGKHPNGIPYGHSPFYGKSRGFNVYVPYSKEDFKLVKNRPTVDANIHRSSDKKYPNNNVSQTSDGGSASDDTSSKAPAPPARSPPPGYRSRASTHSSGAHSAKSSPPDNRSHANSRESHAHSEVNRERSVSFEVPEENTSPTREYAREWKKLTDALNKKPTHRF